MKVSAQIWIWGSYLNPSYFPLDHAAASSGEGRTQGITVYEAKGSKKQYGIVCGTWHIVGTRAENNIELLNEYTIDSQIPWASNSFP